MTTPTPTDANVEQLLAGLGFSEADMADLRGRIAAETSGGASSGASEVPVRTYSAYTWGAPGEAARTGLGHALPTPKVGVQTRPADQVVLDIFRRDIFDDERKRELARKLVEAGMIPEDFEEADIEAAWKKLVQRAATYRQANPNSVLTPDDVLDLKLKGAGHLGSTADGGPKQPSLAEVVTRTRQLSSNTEARKLLQDMMFAGLGRRPSEAELDDFQAALNEAQTKAPVVSTARTKLSAAGEERSRTVTTTGGLDAGQFSEDYVRGQNPDLDSEYGAYQAATTYMNALFQAAQSPVP